MNAVTENIEVTGERETPRSVDFAESLIPLMPLREVTDTVISGLGRNAIAALLKEALDRVHKLEETIANHHAYASRRETERYQLERDNREMLSNLSATQTRSNEILEAFRAAKFVQQMIANGSSHEPLLFQLVTFGAALGRAREKHPEGPDLRSLVEEVGEVANAMRRETPARVREELIDTAVVAFRLAIGEGRIA